MTHGENTHVFDSVATDVSELGFRKFAEFRRRSRKFLHFSEKAAHTEGIEPQRQLLLAIKGRPGGIRPTVTAISQQLCLRHHSSVELIDRLVDRGAFERRHSDEDHRQVLVELTPCGEMLLHRLSLAPWKELHASGPGWSESLRAVMHHPGRERVRRG